MTHPTGLDPVEAATMAATFGVALEKVRRDYLISLVLCALQDEALRTAPGIPGSSKARENLDRHAVRP